MKQAWPESVPSSNPTISSSEQISKVRFLNEIRVPRTSSDLFRHFAAAPAETEANFEEGLSQYFSDPSRRRWIYFDLFVCLIIFRAIQPERPNLTSCTTLTGPSLADSQS